MRKIPVISSKLAIIKYGNGQVILREYVQPATINQVYDAMAGKRKDIVYIKSSIGERPYKIIKENHNI